MGFLITIGVIIALSILNGIFPAFFSKIFTFLFSNNVVCIVVLGFAVIGAILVFAGVWRQITSGVNTLGSGKREKK